jgi:BirA family biotin operon repressor/biotin-[acetyl-CoA-carboxylase] ligase
MNFNTNDFYDVNFLETQSDPFYSFLVFDELPSTNTYLKERAGELAEGSVCIADAQSGGKGRNGRSFYSPKGCGLYLSLLLKPQKQAVSILALTTALACAAAKAIEELYGIDMDIKWLNDLRIGSKKAGGILCESSLRMDGTIDALILGIGINVHETFLPAEIESIACALSSYSDHQVTRNELVVSLLKHFLEEYQNLDQASWLDYYKSHCSMLGTNVIVEHGNRRYEVKALDVLENGALLVLHNGKEEVLTSGEIHIFTNEKRLPV